MENVVGTSLMPTINIINNTDDEIYNVYLSYTYKTVNYIPFDKISTHSSCKSIINLKNINAPISLLLNYSHNGITESQLILKSLQKNNNIFSITLEINIENDSYVVTTIIERDIVDNSIQLSHKDDKILIKSLLFLSAVIIIPSLSYYLINKKKLKNN